MAKLSIGTWAYIFNQEQPTNDFHVILHKLQDLGYEGVELGSFGPHPSPNSHPTRASRQKLRKEIADHGLALSGIAVDLWAFKTPGVSIMDEVPSAYLTAFLGWCVFASELDAKTIRVDTVLAPNYFDTDEGKKVGAQAGMRPEEEHHAAAEVPRRLGVINAQGIPERVDPRANRAEPHQDVGTKTDARLTAD